MFDATEVGKNLAEAAEEAAKSLREFAALVREAEKEAAEQSKYWKFNLEHGEEIAERFADVPEVYLATTDEIRQGLAKIDSKKERKETENSELLRINNTIREIRKLCGDDKAPMTSEEYSRYKMIAELFLEHDSEPEGRPMSDKERTERNEVAELCGRYGKE